MARQIIDFAAFTCVNRLTAVTWSYLSIIDPLAIHSIEMRVIIMVRNVPNVPEITKKSILKKTGDQHPHRKTIRSAEIPWDFSPGGGSDMYGSSYFDQNIEEKNQKLYSRSRSTLPLWISLTFAGLYWSGVSPNNNAELKIFHAFLINCMVSREFIPWFCYTMSLTYPSRARVCQHGIFLKPWYKFTDNPSKKLYTLSKNWLVGCVEA